MEILEKFRIKTYVDGNGFFFEEIGEIFKIRKKLEIMVLWGVDMGP